MCRPGKRFEATGPRTSRDDLDDPMSQSLYVDLYAALWPLTAPERYAGQLDLFDRDQDPERPRPTRAAPAERPRPAPSFHMPDARRFKENRQDPVGHDELKTGDAPGEMFPEIPRDKAFTWRPFRRLLMSRASAEGELRSRSREPGYHAGGIEPAGDYFRVNVLYRYPRIKY